MNDILSWATMINESRCWLEASKGLMRLLPVIILNMLFEVCNHVLANAQNLIYYTCFTLLFIKQKHLKKING